jgi:hypothetical protein
MTTTVTRRWLNIGATMPYRIAAGIIAPGALVGVALAIDAEEKSMLWRIVIGALSLLGGLVFALVALKRDARICLGTTTTNAPD